MARQRLTEPNRNHSHEIPPAIRAELVELLADALVEDLKQYPDLAETADQRKEG